jgi:hypothetical protein
LGQHLCFYEVAPLKRISPKFKKNISSSGFFEQRGKTAKKTLYFKRRAREHVVLQGQMGDSSQFSDDEIPPLEEEDDEAQDPASSNASSTTMHDAITNSPSGNREWRARLLITGDTNTGRSYVAQSAQGIAMNVSRTMRTHIFVAGDLMPGPHLPAMTRFMPYVFLRRTLRIQAAS